MTHTISQRELRNDNAAIMRRVAAGDAFVVTRNGRPIADLSPHQSTDIHQPAPTLAQIQTRFRQLDSIDRAAWEADQADADEFFGADDPLESPGWSSNQDADDRTRR